MRTANRRTFRDASDSFDQRSAPVPWICHFTGPDEMLALQQCDVRLT